MRIVYHALLLNRATKQNKVVSTNPIASEMSDDGQWSLICDGIISRNTEWGFIEGDILKTMLGELRMEFIGFDLAKSIQSSYKNECHDLSITIIAQIDFN